MPTTVGKSTVVILSSERRELKVSKVVITVFPETRAWCQVLRLDPVLCTNTARLNNAYAFTSGAVMQRMPSHKGSKVAGVSKTGLRSTDEPILPVYHPTWPTAVSASFRAVTFNTWEIFCCKWEKKKIQTKHSGPCTWSLCAPPSNVILIVCPAFKFAFCRNISTWPSLSLSELPQSRGARARYAAPFCQQGSFVFFIACHAQRSSPGGSSGVGGA